MKNPSKGKVEPKRRGVPPEDRAAIIESIFARMSEGETLRAICRDPGMPSYGAVYDWIEQDPELASRLECARARGADAIADEAMDIADDRNDDPASRRVRVETRLKLLACWHPKRYGSKQQHEVTGANGEPLIARMDDTARAARIAKLLEMAETRKSETGESSQDS